MSRSTKPVKTDINITGIRSLRKKLLAMPVEVSKAVESSVKMQATTLAGEYARATGPGKSLGETPIVAYQNRVEAQIRHLFPSSDRPGAIAAIISRRSEKLAKAYLRAVRQNKPAQIRRYLREAGIQIETIDSAAHKAARTAQGAGVPDSAGPIAVVNSAKLRPYIREARAKVGMAKASWYQAVLGITKRARTQSREADGTRRTYQKFPALIRKVAARFPGLGGATITGSGTKIEVTIFSNVNHGPEALDQTNFALANTEASVTLKKSISYIVANLNRKLFG